MANDIFGRDVSRLGGTFTADRAKLTLRGNLGTLVQQMNMNYSQMITRLYEVGSPLIYYVGGRTQGQMALSRVVGPAATIQLMYVQYGDVCKARQNVITLVLNETDCSTGQASANRFTMSNCVITAVGVGLAAQDMIIGENSTMIFSSLAAA